MKTKFGAIIVDGRGKLGGHVASKNRAGSYLRQKVTPTNPQTTYQVGVRNDQTSNSKAWRGLTAANRTAWNSSVSDYVGTDIFGDSKSLSGFQLFCKLNGNLKNISASTITTPPSPAAVPCFTSLSVVGDVSDNKVTLTYAGAMAVTEKAVIEATAGLSAGISFAKSHYRKIGVIVSTDVSPFEAGTLYIAKFGTVPAAGKKIFVRMKQVTIANGLAGSYISASVVMVA
jgi:hypothetical protein